jgi:hypothetical protein
VRAPSNRRSDDEGIIAEAIRLLRPLFLKVNVVGWNEKGASTSDPKMKHEAALGLVECLVSDSALDNHFLIEIVRKKAIPILRQALPKGRHGHHGDLNISRDQAIAETVQSIKNQQGLTQERASAVVSEALKRLVFEHRRTLRGLIKKRRADPVWIDNCLRRIDALLISEERVEKISKKYRT